MVDENWKNVFWEEVEYQEIDFVKNWIYVVKNSENNFSLINEEKKVVNWMDKYNAIVYSSSTLKIFFNKDWSKRESILISGLTDSLTIEWWAETWKQTLKSVKEEFLKWVEPNENQEKLIKKHTFENSKLLNLDKINYTSDEVNTLISKFILKINNSNKIDISLNKKINNRNYEFNFY